MDRFVLSTARLHRALLGAAALAAVAVVSAVFVFAPRLPLGNGVDGAGDVGEARSNGAERRAQGKRDGMARTHSSESRGYGAKSRGYGALRHAAGTPMRRLPATSVPLDAFELRPVVQRPLDAGSSSIADEPQLAELEPVAEANVSASRPAMPTLIADWSSAHDDRPRDSGPGWRSILVANSGEPTASITRMPATSEPETIELTPPANVEPKPPAVAPAPAETHRDEPPSASAPAPSTPPLAAGPQLEPAANAVAPESPPPGPSEVVNPFVQSLDASKPASNKPATSAPPGSPASASLTPPPPASAAAPAMRPAATQSTPSSAPARHVGPLSAEVERRVRKELETAFSLADRGAVFSAQARFVQALSWIAQERDELSGGSAHMQALQEGFQVLEDAKDLVGTQATTLAGEDLGRVVRFHRAQLARDSELASITAGALAERYCEHARRQLLAAIGGGTSASKALFGLGKLQHALEIPTASDAELCDLRARAMYQASLDADANNFPAANELGVLLARRGRHEEALPILQHAARVAGDQPQIWHNLAAVHRTLGQHQQAELADAEKRKLTSSAQQWNSPLPPVTWVTPEQFANGAQQAGRTQSAPAPARVPASQAKQGDGSWRRVMLPSDAPAGRWW